MAKTADDLATTDLMRLLAGTIDTRPGLLDIIGQSPPEEGVANSKVAPTGMNIGTGIGAALGDALQAYAKGLNPSMPVGNSVQQLMRRREVQAERDARAQNQTRRQDFIGKQNKARLALGSLERSEDRAQQKELADAAREQSGEIAREQMTSQERLTKMRIDSDQEITRMRMEDPKGAAALEQNAGLASQLSNAYIFGDAQSGLVPIKERLAAGESADDILYEFERRLLEIRPLSALEKQYIMEDFKQQIQRFTPEPEPVVEPIGAPMTQHQAIPPADSGSLWETLNQAISRPAFFKR